jgi:hypothetical protein
MYVEMDTIVMDKKDYDYWQNNGGVYLQFDYTQRKHYVLYDFDELNEGYKLIQEHYNSEDEYKDALYECNEFLYYEGYYLFEDDFEGEDDSMPVWSATAIGDKVVVSRAYLWS